MIDLRKRPVRVAAIAALTALSFAAAAFAAAAVRYSGQTSQQRPISFTLSGSQVRALKYHIEDRCAGGKFLLVNAWGFPALEVKNSKFGGKFVGKAPQKATAVVRGSVTGSTISGTLSDQRINGKTHKRCAGTAGFTLTRERRKHGSDG